MNKLAIIAAAALSAGTFGLAAIAQDAVVDKFDNADANNDEIVSFEEAMGVYPTLTQVLFDQADADKNGTLDEGEFTGLVALVPDDGTTSSESSSEPSSSSSSSSAP